jgi:CPA2 family monovalent cation:H+ antiporter-2
LNYQEQEHGMNFSSAVVADLAIIMIIAAVVVFIFYRLKQPMIIGYLIAGIIIGPYTPPSSLISQPEVFSATADLGVILLLFGIGMKFPLNQLLKVGKVSLGVAGIEIAFMLLLSLGISRILHWSLIEALFLGTALASSSTAIIAKVLSDMGKLKDTPSLIMLGVLVVEDLIVVGLLAVITSSIGNGGFDIGDVAWVVVKILALMTGSLMLGIMFVPMILNKLVDQGNREVVLLVTLGLVFGLSIIASLLGFSMAIGAFLMGVIVASARSADYINILISPIKDMFAAIFFVSMGALINISQFKEFIVPALLVTVLMIIGKSIGCGLGIKLFKYDNSTALIVGLGMSQIGEFAFIVMKAGQDVNLVSPLLFSTVGVSAGITTFLTPYLMRLSYRIKFKPRPLRKGEPAGV